MMPVGECKLCQETKELMRSHAIPDAIFRRLLKPMDGKAFFITNDLDTPARYSSDSWWTYQLCNHCEGLINEFYERYSLEVFRGREGTLTKHDLGITFNKVNVHKINNFFISILWRAAESNNPAYSRVFMPDYYSNHIRLIILEDRTASASNITVEISRLKDSLRTNRFTQEALKELLISPFFRSLKEELRFSFCFLLEGFFIEIFLPGHRHKERKGKSFLQTSKNSIYAPFIDILEIPELFTALANAHQKLEQEQSNTTDNKQ